MSLQDNYYNKYPLPSSKVTPSAGIVLKESGGTLNLSIEKHSIEIAK